MSKIFLTKFHKTGLRSIRQDKNIEDEIKEILNELSLNSSNDNASILDIFKAKELKWSLLTSILLQVLQQLCGINAVTFIFRYLTGIFRFFFKKKTTRFFFILQVYLLMQEYRKI